MTPLISKARWFALTAFVAAAPWLGQVASSGTESGGAARPDQSCKPQGPVALTIVQVAGGSVGAADLAFSLEPRRELHELRWELRLSDGVLLMDGHASGVAASGLGAVTVGEVRVDVPSRGEHHRVELAAQGVFLAGDGAGQEWLEPFEVTTALRWGQPRPDAPVVTRVGAHGQLEQAVLVPSTWREGR